jgi:predicted esterase
LTIRYTYQVRCILILVVLGSLPSWGGARACPVGFEAIGADGCLLAPKSLADPRKLVVYFHGMLPPTVEWANAPELKVMGAEARRRGYALLALKGEKGLCLWSKEVLEYSCWPNDKSQLAELSRQLRRLEGVLTKVREKLGVRAEPPFFAGFSNGGFFLTLLASDSSLPMQGLAVLHAGSVNGQQFSNQQPRPTLLVAAQDDAVQLPTMKRLEQLMKEAGWEPDFRLREGTHGVTASDAQAMFGFFDRLGSN